MRLTHQFVALFVTVAISGCSDTQQADLPADQPNQAIKDSSLQNSNLQQDPPQVDSAKADSEYQSQIRFAALSPQQFPQVIPDNGARHGYATILESLGSGVAAMDFDRDGWTDALIGGGGDLLNRKFTGKPIHVLRNLKTHFQSVTEAAGLLHVDLYHHGLAAHDFNNDGFIDLLVTGYGAVRLFENLGDGSFLDVTSESQLLCPTWTASAAWADFNEDGFPDVYVTGYVDWSWDNDPPCYARDGVRRDNCSPRLFNAVPDFLFYGRGDGTFQDVTSEMKIKPDGKSLGVVCADIDQDSDIDLYVGNDVMMNYVYRNNDGKSFEDWSVASGASVSQRGSPDASMGVAIADYNLDGEFDVWAANFEMESFALYHHHGSMMFRHMSESTGITAIGGQYVGWGSVFEDLDLDGDPDLTICNGHVVMFPEHSPAQQRMVVLENQNAARFVEVTKQVGEAVMQPLNGRGLAATDWNRDGRIDLITSPIHSPAQLLSNESKGSNNWITLKLIGTATNTIRQPIGCLVELKTNRRTYHRQVIGGGSYASTNREALTFGIPSDETVQSLTIRWPGNSPPMKFTIDELPINSHTTVIQTSATQGGVLTYSDPSDDGGFTKSGSRK